MNYLITILTTRGAHVDKKKSLLLYKVSVAQKEISTRLQQKELKQK